MTKTKKSILVVACAIMLVAMSVMGTLAYLTSDDAVTNTFTVGKVEITLDETDVDLYGVPDGTTRVTANTYKLIPGHKYTKDPIVHVTAGSEKCWLFVKVTNGISDIEADTKIADQMRAKGWNALTVNDEIVEDVYYHETVDASAATADVTVFEDFKIKSDADVSAYEGMTITVQAYAVQADGFGTAEAAWNATFGKPADESETE